MADVKDKSGLTPKERHKIVTNYLKEIKKKPKVFHLRWKPGDLIDGNVMKKTPLFWYMRYGWSRIEIETMLFKAKVEIDEVLDNGLQQVFGGDSGPRWKGGGNIPTRKKWKNRAYASQKPYNINQNKDLQGGTGNDDDDTKLDKGNSSLDKDKLKGKENDVWNAVSNFGESEWIDYKKFSDNMKERGIKISPEIAKALFDQIADPKTGKITKKQMEELMKKLDNMQFGDNFANIGIDDLKTPFGAYTVMKKVLLSAAIGQPFDVDGFLINAKMELNMGPAGLFLGKLADRDADWNDRLKAMEMISSNINNPAFDNLFQPDNAQELLCGWAAQILDGKPEIQKKAIDDIPLIFHSILAKDPQLPIGHLEEIFDNLFKVLDDPHNEKNHPAAKEAVKKIVDDVLNTGDPEAVLYAAGILGEKTKMENCTNPKARQFALEQLQRIMFGEESPYVMNDKSDPKKIPSIEDDKLPQKPSQNREWLDIGAYIEMGPSDTLMYGGKLYDKLKPDGLAENPGGDVYEDDESSNQKGKNVRSQESEGKDNNPKVDGFGDEETMTGGPGRSGPIVALHCDDRFPKKGQPVNFWVTARNPNKSNAPNDDPNKPNNKNKDPLLNPDGTPKTAKPGDKNPYTKKNPYGTGPYKDKDDPTNPNDPVNNPNSNNPKNKSNVGPNDPEKKIPDDFINPDQQDYIKKYEFDFDDGDEPLETDKPKAAHPYKKKGPKKATVTATDKYGLTGSSTIDLDVDGDPNKPKNIGPILDVAVDNPNPEKGEPVRVIPRQLGGTSAIKEFEVDFGDGTPPQKFAPNKPIDHVYKSGGPKVLTVKAIDENGLPGTQQAKIDVKGDPRGPIVALHCDDKTPKKGQPVNFWVTALNPNDPDNEVPISGPGVKPKNKGKPYHSYGKPGNKKEFNKDNPMGDPNEHNPNKAGPNKNDGNLPNFENPDGLPQIVEYDFDFGDDSPNDVTDKPKTTHPYEKKGPKKAKVVATDINGLQGSSEVELDVDGDPKKPKQIGPITTVNVSNDNPKPNEPVKFTVQQLGGTSGIKEYTYDFGDGTPPITTNKPEIEHKYPDDVAPGTKVATVTTKDANGLEGTSQVKMVIGEEDPTAPVVALHCDDKNPKIGQPVNFWVTALDPNDPNNYNGGPKGNYGNTGKKGGGPVQYPNQGKGGNTGYDPTKYPDEVDDPESKQDNDKPNKSGPVNKGPKGQDYGNPNANNPNKKGPNSNDNNLPGFQNPDKLPNIVKYDFGFGDKSPHDITDKPKSQHPYKTKGPKTATVTVTDINGLQASSEIDLDVDGKPKKPKNVGPIIAATVDKPKVKRNEPVTVDVTQLGGSAPIREYIFDFGDGSEPIKTKKPQGIHKYPRKGVPTATITAIDDNGLTGTTQARVQVAGGYTMDDDDPGRAKDKPSNNVNGPKGKGNRSKPGYAGPVNMNDDEKKQDPYGGNKNPQGTDNNDALSPKEIGDEFRNILTDAVSGAVMDPNKKNNEKGKKMVDLMNEINPKWDKNLDPEARKRYLKYKGPPLKPYKPQGGPPAKKLPGLVVGKKRVHQIDETFAINIAGPTMPDI